MAGQKLQEANEIKEHNRAELNTKTLGSVNPPSAQQCGAGGRVSFVGSSALVGPNTCSVLMLNLFCRSVSFELYIYLYVHMSDELITARESM